VFYLLESYGFETWLVNARDVKHLPGRPKWAALFFPDSCLIAILCCGLPVQVLVVDLLWGLVPEC
jgi:hypothetical protein